MFWLIYNTFLILGFPVIIGLLLTKKRCQRGILARLGKVPAGLQSLPGRVVWVHAASLGEVTAVVPLVKAMKEEDPLQEIVVSTVTETGREVVVNQLHGLARHCYAPIDMWWAVTRYVQALNPSLFLLVESEIWPNLLGGLQKYQVPVCLVNGRISSRSFVRYRLVKKFMRSVWASLDLALMQTAQDAERIRQLGAQVNGVHVTGNMKFDQSFESSHHIDVPQSLRSSLGIHQSELVIVAGSTHAQEEEFLLQAYKVLLDAQKHVVLVLAPRHIERVPELEKIVARYQLPCVRRSQMHDRNAEGADSSSPRVILLDSRGELPYVYSLGSIGFVGGTLVPVGGHNLLEPAQWSRPVLFGPYIDHCREMAEQLLQAGGAIQIEQPQQLGEQLLYVFEHPQEVEQMGRQALSVIQKNQGVVKKNLKMIRQLTNHSDSRPLDLGRTGFGSSVSPTEVGGNHYESSFTISS